MSKIIFITGGARSGKSDFAIKIAKKFNRRVAFIATCIPEDKEMLERIKIHKSNRPLDWETIEEPKNLIPVLRKLKNKTVIIDCITLLVSNLLLSGISDEEILKDIKEIIKVLKRSNLKVIFVSNEVGAGIVPANKIARRFRDLAGRVNQIIAQNSDECYLLVAGIPVKIK